MMTIAVVEDHPDFRDTLCAALSRLANVRLLPPCKDQAAAQRLVEGECPDLLLVDLCLPHGGDGMTVIRQAYRLWGSRCTSAVLTVARNEEYLLDAIRAGAKGYLSKSSSTEEWCQTVREYEEGRSPINATLARIFQKELRALLPRNLTESDTVLFAYLQLVAAGYSTPEAAERLNIDEVTAGRIARLVYERFFEASRKVGPKALSPKEAELLQLIADGRSNRQCAVKLGVAESTVKTFTQRLYEKLRVNNRSEALVEARRQGLLS